MNLGSVASASHTLFERARQTHGVFRPKNVGDAHLATPGNGISTVIAAASGAPAAPAGPLTGRLAFAARLGAVAN